MKNYLLTLLILAGVGMTGCNTQNEPELNQETALRRRNCRPW